MAENHFTQNDNKLKYEHEALWAKGSVANILTY